MRDPIECIIAGCNTRRSFVEGGHDVEGVGMGGGGAREALVRGDSASSRAPERKRAKAGERERDKIYVFIRGGWKKEAADEKM